MRPHATPEAAAPPRSPRRALVSKLARYGTGSLVATVCSEVTFVVLYAVGAPPWLASVLGWLAGAVPNFWLNRNWTWGRRGRPSLRQEVVPYAVIVLVTLAVAIAATTAVDAALRGGDLSHAVRSLVVGATFLMVYVVIFVLRFFLLDRLFTRLHRSGVSDPAGTR